MTEMDTEFQVVSSLEAQAGREAMITLLSRHRANVDETLAQLCAMKDAIDFAAIKMISHRMRGACGSLGFTRISALFARMDKAASQSDSAAVAEMIEAAAKENALLAAAIRERYPEI